jgi:type IV pilus assembly protein PilA
MSRSARNGFTLIELLIVVVIIGILAAVAIPKFAATKSKAYEAAMKSDIKNAMTAAEAFFADNNTYTGAPNPPTSVNVLLTEVQSATGVQFTATHSAVAGRTCQGFVGSPALAGFNEGEVRCQ